MALSSYKPLLFYKQASHYFTCISSRFSEIAVDEFLRIFSSGNLIVASVVGKRGLVVRCIFPEFFEFFEYATDKMNE
jgi:hypothetical protein